jgi:uncharacterized membrane protein
MQDMPVDAQVVCADGPCGESITVIVERGTRKVTHLVVKDETLPRPPYQRMVPVDQVVETSHDEIHLRCTREEVGHMEPFIRTRYIPKKQPDYSMYQGGEGPSASSSTVGVASTKVEEEMIPEGELAVRWGTRVEATDGHVGHVAELLSEEGSDEISHLVLQEGHLWGKKEVILPAAAVEKVEGDTVYLKLDKGAIGLLPTIPLKRDYAAGRSRIELVIRVFDDSDKAYGALEFVEGLRKQRIIKVLNAAILVKDQDGQVSIQDTKEIDAKKGRLMGAIIGGLVGLLAGPGGAVVGALVGLATGGAAGKYVDEGFDDKFLANLHEHLQPGKSALVLLMEHQWVHKAAESMSDLGGMVFQQTITDTLVEDLLENDQAGG